MSKAKVICFANQKGGVAKTTSCIVTSSALTKKGYKVLAIDLDPQCNTTNGMNIELVEADNTVFDALYRNTDVNDCIITTPLGDVLAGSPDLAAADKLFDDANRDFLVRGLVDQLTDVYDYILIDTPPALGWSLRNALTAAEWIVVPCNPDLWSNDAIKKLYDSYTMVHDYTNPNIKFAGILITNLEERLNASKFNVKLTDIASTNFAIPVFETRIHKSTNVRDAFNNLEDLLTDYPQSRPAIDYQQFTDELLDKVA